jgi:hypothetical protein
MGKNKNKLCLKKDIQSFLALPRPNNGKYKMPKETEKTIRNHIRQLNGIFPQFKIKTNDFLSLIRKLYVHPDSVQKSSKTNRITKRRGVSLGGKGRTIAKGRRRRSRSRSRSRSNSKEVVEYIIDEPKSSFMDKDILMAICTFLFSIFLSYIVFVRVQQLDEMTNVSGHINEIQTTIVDEFKKMNKEEITYFSFWCTYFKNITCNAIHMEKDKIFILIKNIGSTIANDVYERGKNSCMDPSSTIDIITTYLSPSTTDQCAMNVFENVMAMELASIKMIIGEIQKKSSDAIVISNAAVTMGISSMSYLTYRTKAIYNGRKTVRLLKSK